MSEGDLPAPVYDLIRAAVPTMDALDLLVFLARHPDSQWTAEAIVTAIRPAVVQAEVVREILAHFRSRGLVREVEASRFRFEPSSTAQTEAVDALVKAYNERPVTLIRALYTAAATRGPQSFADAFKITKDPS